MTDLELASVRLSDRDTDLEATFVPGANMLCCSLRHRGEELLAQNAGVAAYAARGKTMGIPLLYPWANRLAGFDYTVAGRAVQVPHDPALIALDDNGLPIHGAIGGRIAWELVDAPSRDATAGLGAKANRDATGGLGAKANRDATGGLGAKASRDATGGLGAKASRDATGGSGSRSSHDANAAPATAPAPGARSLKARLNWNEAQPELFDVFPFEHDLTYEARLGDGRLEIEVIVHARGPDAVPLAFGFHPYLAPGGRREDWLIELPAMRHLELDREQIPLGPEEQASGPQRFELGGREFDDGFDVGATPGLDVVPGADSTPGPDVVPGAGSTPGPAPVRFAVTAGARRLELALERGYPYAQLYAPLSGQFICFEPMTAPANALRSGEGLRLLAPGERHSASFSIQIKNLAVQRPGEEISHAGVTRA